jgi:hypothetical protein
VVASSSGAPKTSNRLMQSRGAEDQLELAWRKSLGDASSIYKLDSCADAEPVLNLPHSTNSG